MNALSVSELRDLAMNYLDVASDMARGRGESDPLYKAITEKRDFGKGYSSCGDLVHWLYYRLGVRGHWLNRTEFQGWKAGVNLWRLAFDCRDGRPPRIGEVFEAGDVLLVWNKANGTDGHVLVVRDHEPGVLHSVDGGQPGICRVQRTISEDSFQLSAASGSVSKRVQRVLKFKDVISGSFSRQELLESEQLGDWLGRVKSKTSPARSPQLPTLRLGDRDEVDQTGPVHELQAALNRHGAALFEDGHFGPVTNGEVCKFQLACGLESDGIVGRLAWEVLLS